MPPPAIELPLPPSVNSIWRVTKVRSRARVTLSAQYRVWLDEAILLLRMNMTRAKAYPVCVTLTIVRGIGWRKGRDADNCLKVVLDALVKSQRLGDDDEDHVVRCVVEFGPRRPTQKACVLVCVEPVQPAAEAVA